MRADVERLKAQRLRPAAEDRVPFAPFPGPQAWACDSAADVLGFGGAAGGGKSYLLLGLAATRHRRSLVLRREAKQGRGLIDDARQLLGGLGRFNENTGVWRDLPGGRQIRFGGVANPGDEQAYKGQPRDLLAIDEADQFREPVVRFLMGWLRTTEVGQRCRVVLTFNPPSTAEGRWLLDYFGPWLDPRHHAPAAPGELRWYAMLPSGVEVERPDGGPFEHRNEHRKSFEVIRPKSRTFIPARVEDNPALMATDYLSQLLAMPEPLRSQLAYGDMQAGTADDAWQVIPTAWVRAAQERWTPDPPGRLSCLGVDVAYGGADATVVVPRHGGWFGRATKWKGQDTDSGMKAAYWVMERWRDDAVVNVDAIGYGAACHEHLRERVGKLAVAVNAAAATEHLDRSKKFRLTNTRAAMYWLLREALDPETGDGLALPPDPELLADLCAPRYEVRSSGIVVEPKEKVKERIGRSPDVGDAAVLAHWQTPRRKMNVF